MTARNLGGRRAGGFILAALFILLCIGGTLALADDRTDGVSPSNQWVDLYSIDSEFDGQLLQPGDVVAVFDPDGVQCGEFVVQTEGYYGLMPCYGDDSDTLVDEGAVTGDVLHFTVNGFAAQTTAITHNGVSVPGDTDIVWNQHGERWQVDLGASGAVSEPSIAIVDTGVELSWDDVGGSVDHYEVWRSATPYFSPGDTGSQRIADNVLPVPGGRVHFIDEDSNLGHPETNDYYLVRTIYTTGRASPSSPSTAAFDFALTPGASTTR